MASKQLFVKCSRCKEELTPMPETFIIMTLEGGDTICHGKYYCSSCNNIEDMKIF